MFGIYLLVGLLLIFFLEAVFDYPYYETQWLLILDGQNPWKDIPHKNAYGPIYNLFSLPYKINNKLPHVIFFICWLISCHLLSRANSENNKIGQTNTTIRGAIILNPFFFLMVVRYGANDAFLAALTILGLVAYVDKKYVTSGMIFSSAVFFKFMPIFIIPFLSFPRGIFNRKFAVSFGIFSIIILAISWNLWDENIVEPIFYGEHRPSKILSIFRFLRGRFSPFKFFDEDYNIDFISIPLLLLTNIVFIIIHLKLRFDAIYSSVLSLSFTVLLYKVGHFQFYITFLMTIIFLFIYAKDNSVNNKSLTYSGYLLIGWISLIGLIYHLTSAFSGSWGIFRHIIGLPTFVIHSYFNLELFQAMKAEINDHKLSKQAN